MKNWLPGAMYPSELRYLIEKVKEAKVEILIECGRQDAVSTEYLEKNLGFVDKIYSIDFDENNEKLKQQKERFANTKVELISGDIHVNVPKILFNNPNKRIGIIQDGPKGWEGLGTLLASAHLNNVILIGQHNLHIGHKSRKFFEELFGKECFLENDNISEPKKIWLEDKNYLSKNSSNRPKDHTSLGIAIINNRDEVIEKLIKYSNKMGIYNSTKVFKAWSRGDFQYVSNRRKKERFSLQRFKKR